MDIKKNQALKGRSQDWNAAPIINPGANLIWITFDHFCIVAEEALKECNIAELAAHIVYPGANLTWKTFRPFCTLAEEALKGRNIAEWAKSTQGV